MCCSGAGFLWCRSLLQSPLEHVWEEVGGNFLEVCLVSHPKGCKSSRRSGWQWKVKLGELMTHVLQEGQVEPLCVTVKLSMIFIKLTACWLAGR